jgi:hypothetical protein
VLTVVLDPTERKRQRNKERYASLSREQKDELNRKARERRAEKKKCDQASLRDEGAYNLLTKVLLNRTHVVV